MTLPVYFRAEAEQDLDEAAGWYEKQQPGLGQQFLDEVLVALAQSVSSRPCTPRSEEVPGALSSVGFPSASITDPRKTASWSSRSCMAAAARGAGKEEHNIGSRAAAFKWRLKPGVTQTEFA